jgi:hypothetical protein
VRDIPGLLAQAEAIATAIQAHDAIFATPTPSVAALMDGIVGLRQAHTLVLGKTKGAAKTRRVKETALRKLLGQSRSYVQCIVDNIADPEAAVAAAYSASMREKVHGVRIKPLIKIMQNAMPGRVVLEGRAAPRGASAFYEWRYTLNGGIDWIEVRPTNTADVTIGGLPSNVVIGFQYRYTQRNITEAWSQTVTAFVR